jgi:hypothetical protein
LPRIDAARRANPAMKSIAAQLHFKDRRLPVRRHHELIAVDLIRAIEAGMPRILPGQSLEVCFQPRETVSKLPIYAGNLTWLAAEDFPVAAEHFDITRLESDPNWETPLWWSPPRIGGWNAPSADKFGQILADKREEAKKYDTKGRPLWLLIVTEFANDLESHVFPREGDDLAYLREQIAATEFDFAGGPFQQVWLLSEFTQGCVRLYPTEPSRLPGPASSDAPA